MKNMLRTLSRHLPSALATLTTITLLQCTSSALAAIPAPDGLVGWWRGESNVVDSAGSASGYTTNGAGYGPGKVGTGISLDGATNRVIVPDTTSLNFGSNQNFSIEVWMQAQPTPDNYLGYTVIADKASEPDVTSSLGW